jgi:hypothetical protein
VTVGETGMLVPGRRARRDEGVSEEIFQAKQTETVSERVGREERNIRKFSDHPKISKSKFIRTWKRRRARPISE